MSPPLCELILGASYFLDPPSTPITKTSDSQTSSLLRHLLFYICLLDLSVLLTFQPPIPSLGSNHRHDTLRGFPSKVLPLLSCREVFVEMASFHGEIRWSQPTNLIYTSSASTSIKMTLIPRLNENDTLSLKSTYPTSLD